MEVDVVKEISELNNRDIIYKNSHNYNIINKIKDLENIISQNLIEMNIVIITSVLNWVSSLIDSMKSSRSPFILNKL